MHTLSFGCFFKNTANMLLIKYFAVDFLYEKFGLKRGNIKTKVRDLQIMVRGTKSNFCKFGSLISLLPNTFGSD